MKAKECLEISNTKREILNTLKEIEEIVKRLRKLKSTEEDGYYDDLEELVKLSVYIGTLVNFLEGFKRGLSHENKSNS